MNYSNSKNKVKDYWEKESHFYDEKLNNWYLFYDYNLRLDLVYKAIIKWKNIFFKGNISIVDFGCGNGDNLVKFSKISNKVYGVDISPNMVKLSREKNPTLEIFYGEITSFNKKVNIVTAIGLVEYLDNIDDLFSSSKKILTDEGLLIFSFNKKNSFLGLVESFYRYLKNSFAKNRKQSLNKQYSNLDIENILKIYDFEIIDSVDFGFRSNIFAIGILKFIYPFIEILFHHLIKNKYLRRKITINKLIVCKSINK